MYVGKIFVQDKRLEEYTPAGEVGWVSQINTVKSSAIFLQIRARLTFKTSASRSLHDSLNSFFKHVESHPPFPATEVLFHLCWHFCDIILVVVWFNWTKCASFYRSFIFLPAQMLTLVFFKSNHSVVVVNLILSSKIVLLNIDSFFNSFTTVSKHDIFVPNNALLMWSHFSSVFNQKK